MRLKHPEDNGHGTRGFGRRRGRRRLRTVAMLPTLLTLGSLYFGFAAIYCCTREMQDLGAGVKPSENRTLDSDFFEHRAPSFLSIACWMVLAAMICDALDGRVARKTNQMSQFGEQLDSLADIVSFGAAPALMMVTLVRRELARWGYAPFYFDQFSEAVLFVGVVYLCCAALRLARFTVEASLEEAAHTGFRGLPSPGAAAGIISVIFLHDHLVVGDAWPATARVLVRALPICTLAIALLMVSRVPFRHAVSAFLRRRPFGHIIGVLLLVPIILLYPEHMAVLGAWVFIASGPVRSAWRWFRPESEAGEADPLEADAGEPHEPASPLRARESQ